MKIWVEKLGEWVEAPGGRVMVLEGVLMFGDLVWVREDAGVGSWAEVTHYNVGQDVEGYWCVMRVWADEGVGI